MNVKITDIDGKKPTFTQWDVDRVLYIDGCDSQPCLHFANPMLTRAIVVEAEADGSRWSCQVPNIILQTAAPIVISVFVQPDEGKTVLTDWVKVQPKLKPQDYTYEENIGYTNWVQKTQEAEELLATLEETCDQAQDLVEDIQGKLNRGEFKGEKGDPGDTKVFIAQYGTTTSAEVADAISAEKVIFANHNGGMYLLSSWGTVNDVTTYYFARVPVSLVSSSHTAFQITLASDVWAGPTQIKIATAESPVLTGTPRAPTAAAGDDGPQIATTAFVQRAISALEERIQALEGGN
jgi:hypothetical protein